jgi:hypothetical protein
MASASADADKDPLEVRSMPDIDPVPIHGSAFIRQDHRGVVDRLIQDEQERYARENMKPRTESTDEPSPSNEIADITGFGLHSGPLPFYQPKRREEPHYVGVFGRPGHYRVEVYYRGSMMDYAVGDRLPGGYRLTGVRSQYITVTQEDGEAQRIYLTSRHAVDRQAGEQGDSGPYMNDLPPGLLR